MNHERVDETAAGDDTGESKPTFTVAIVYDDRIAATRAMNVFSDLLRQFGDDFDFQCELWRFDVLELPETIKAAVLAGEIADLIIVSARCDSDLPSSVKDWLNQCVAVKSPGSAALVGLLASCRESGNIHCRTRHFLQSAADRGLMDFLVSEVDLLRTNTVSPVPEAIRSRNQPPQRPGV